MNIFVSTDIADKNNINRLSGLTRTRAALIHLAISVMVAVSLVALMLFVWYPQPYFEAMGGGLLLALIVGVDVIIGPIITLVIFDLKKKALKFDLLFVVLLQTAAFVYGASIMFAARPVYTVYFRDRFEVVSPSRIPSEELDKVVQKEFKRNPITGPVVVASRQPTDVQESNRVLFHPEAAGDLVAFPQHYVPYSEEAKRAGSASKPIADLRKKDPTANARLDAYIKEHALEEAKLGYLPVNTRASDMAAIMDRDSGKLHGFVFANPW
jgi:hypothetical protein